MKLEMIPPHVLDAVRSRELFTDAAIELMPAEKLFDEYCRWEGIIGFGPDLWQTALDLKALED